MHSPAADQIEINIFGPGYGECSVVHLGSNQWVIIDSCIDSDSKLPAATQYLKAIGADIARDVKLIIATHWHDDHIRGLSDVVAECSTARFSLAAAVTSKEFLELLTAIDEKHGISSGSGASELNKIMSILRIGRRPAQRVVPNTLLLSLDAIMNAHGKNCQVWGLSPSASQYDLSLAELGNLMPAFRSAKIRYPKQGRNDLSVVTLIKFDDISLLFGADLEERSDPLLGWSAIVDLENRSSGRSVFFKIPHHGSSNGHLSRVWQEMLVDHPITVLTPWNKGRGLPLDSDIRRIKQHSGISFSTSAFVASRGRKRDPVVQRQLRESSNNLRAGLLKTGHVQIRSRPGGPTDIWSIETFSGACHVDRLLEVA